MEIADNVNDELKRSKRCLVVVGEGLDVGDIGAQRDPFGHTSYSASERTVQQVVTAYRNKAGLRAAGHARTRLDGEVGRCGIAGRRAWKIRRRGRKKMTMHIGE
ncbi:MAG: hypothetical protein WCL16_01985, partial [bacterium]